MMETPSTRRGAMLFEEGLQEICQNFVAALNKGDAAGCATVYAACLARTLKTILDAESVGSVARH
jgi:hypothetical protein